MNCLTCGGLIMEPGKTYGYAGPVCHCSEGPRIRKRPTQPGPKDVSGYELDILRRLQNPEFALHYLREMKAERAQAQARIANAETVLADKRKWIHRLIPRAKERDQARARVRELEAEVERLQRILARELSENDELGAEYAYVVALKNENARLKAVLEEICDRKWLRNTSLLMSNPPQNAAVRDIQIIAKEAISSGKEKCNEGT